MTTPDTTRKSTLVTVLAASSQASLALALSMPLVALGLVIAYAIGHFHGLLRIGVGYVACVLVVSALPEATRLRQTLRLGQLKVSGVVVRRTEAPRRFWTWTSFGMVFTALRFAAGVMLAWTALFAMPGAPWVVTGR